MDMPHVKLEIGGTYDLLDLLTEYPYISSSAEECGPQVYLNLGIGEESNRLELLMLIGRSASQYYVFQPDFSVECCMRDIVQSDRFSPVVMLQEELDEFVVRVDQNGRIDPEHSTLTISLNYRYGRHNITFIPNSSDESIADRMVFPMLLVNIRKNPVMEPAI